MNDDDVTFFNDPKKKTHTQIVSLPLLISPQDIFISIFLDRKKRNYPKLGLARIDK